MRTSIFKTADFDDVRLNNKTIHKRQKNLEVPSNFVTLFENLTKHIAIVCSMMMYVFYTAQAEQLTSRD